LTKKRISSLIVAALSVALSACVTQEFENDETPVVKNQANKDDMAATRVSLGLGYLRMGNMSQAKQNLEKAKKFAPEMVQVYTGFAHYYETVGENKLAIASFEQALLLKSDDADTLNNYGVFLCRQDQTEAAEKQLLKAIAVPSYILVAKSYENLSSCFLQKDNFDKAEMYLYKAVMHSPGNSSILLQMVRLQYAMGAYTEAKSYEQRFEKVTRRFSPRSLALAYKVYLKLGQRQTAKSYGTMLVKMYPQSWEAQQYLLNELEFIEADSLAKRYKLTQVSEKATQSKKRVVKLSPKKALLNDAANSSSLVESAVAKRKVLQAATVRAFTATKNNTMAPSMLIASSSAINAALTMESSETVTPVFESTQVIDNQLPTSPIEQDKRVVVLVAPKVLEDREIFKVAKKPVLISADAPKAEEPLPIDSTQIQQGGDVINKSPKIHVVSIGDTLFGISTKYNIKIRALRRWNNLAGNKKIRINDKLHLIAPQTVNK
jgi:type IV pilus assembly protein PilF